MLPNGSNTYAGLIVVLIGLIANAFGFHIASSENLSKLIFDLLEIAGTAYAWYGRARASTPGFLVKNTPTV